MKVENCFWTSEFWILGATLAQFHYRLPLNWTPNSWSVLISTAEPSRTQLRTFIASLTPRPPTSWSSNRWQGKSWRWTMVDTSDSLTCSPKLRRCLSLSRWLFSKRLSFWRRLKVASHHSARQKRNCTKNLIIALRTTLSLVKLTRNLIRYCAYPLSSGCICALAISAWKLCFWRRTSSWRREATWFLSNSLGKVTKSRSTTSLSSKNASKAMASSWDQTFLRPTWSMLASQRCRRWWIRTKAVTRRYMCSRSESGQTYLSLLNSIYSSIQKDEEKLCVWDSLCEICLLHSCDDESGARTLWLWVCRRLRSVGQKVLLGDKAGRNQEESLTYVCEWARAHT